MKTSKQQILEAAMRYREAGISVIPVNGDKRPAIPSWKAYQNRLPNEQELKQWFDREGLGVGVIGGRISGNIEIIDFDVKKDERGHVLEGERGKSDERMGVFYDLVLKEEPDLFKKLVVEKSPSGGYHIIYRCPQSAGVPTQDLALNASGEVMIETRGEGAYCVVAPSNGYRLLTNDIAALPSLTPAERATLLNIAKSLDQKPKSTTYGYNQNDDNGLSVGADFDMRGDIKELLTKAGWVQVSNEAILSNGFRAERWRRPGKDRGSSASLIYTEDDRTLFYNFSSSAPPFERDTAYSPFAVYAFLEQDGDFKASARELAKQGYGDPNSRKSIMSRGGITFVSGKDLMGEFDTEIRWRWRTHFPEAMPVMVAGREGSGKTSICLKSAKEMLDANPEGCIVWVATEGQVQDTLVKMKRFGLVTNPRFVIARKVDGSFLFNFTYHKERKLLDESLSELPAILAVFIDSIRGMRGKMGDNESEIAHTMHSLNEIVCDKHKATLVYLDHFGKNALRSMLDQIVGTTVKTGAVRIAYGVEMKSARTRVIKVAKKNLFEDIPLLVSIMAQGQISIQEVHSDTSESQTVQAEKWLLDNYAGKEPLARDLYDAGKKVAFSVDVLKRAKRNLGIISERTDPRDKKSPWKWVIPKVETGLEGSWHYGRSDTLEDENELESLDFLNDS